MSENNLLFTAIIVDDEPSLLNGLKDSINWAQFHIDVIALASNGKDALKLIIENEPDIAIIDIRMPQMSGLEVIQAAKDAQMTTDFIILSGYDDFSYAKSAIRLGAKAYLLKPLNTDEFYNELFRICSKRIRSRESDGSKGKLVYSESQNITFLRNIIDGKVLESGSIHQILLASGLKLADSFCYVLVLSYESDLPQSKLDKTIYELNSHFRFERQKFWKYDDHKIIGIFNTSNTTPLQSAMKCLNLITEKDLPMPRIGVGDTVSGLSECSYSYNRALMALTYELYDRDCRIFTYEIICTVPPKITLSDIDYLPLVQAIVKKDLDGIESYCDQFVEKLLYVPMPPPNYVFSLCYAFFHLVENELSSFTKRELPRTADANELYQFRQLSLIRQWMVKSFTELSNYIDSVYGYSKILPAVFSRDDVVENTDDKIIKTAICYISQNIHQQLKVQDIAKQVHLSPSYFAIYFKNKTNVNFRTYLLWKKMEYARLRLMDPDSAINDIAYELGYGDSRSFSRAFKNINGISPSAFQEREGNKAKR